MGAVIVLFMCASSCYFSYDCLVECCELYLGAQCIRALLFESYLCVQCIPMLQFGYTMFILSKHVFALYHGVLYSTSIFTSSTLRLIQHVFSLVIWGDLRCRMRYHALWVDVPCIMGRGIMHYQKRYHTQLNELPYVVG